MARSSRTPYNISLNVPRLSAILVGVLLGFSVLALILRAWFTLGVDLSLAAVIAGCRHLMLRRMEDPEA
ncbi:MAG: hypothetical protein QOG43_544 [Actinomycetota bacterium]|jgi:hypothetical protein|nr:hypothetical protein [Actinomycetota bacterium]